jgi:trehalose 6-phosphate phosphatase
VSSRHPVVATVTASASSSTVQRRTRRPYLSTVADPLDPLRDRPDRCAVLTDFDGTLSPIVEDWTAASPLPGVRDVLEHLTLRYAIVAVISGRPVAYLSEHLGTGLRLAGLYGLESMVDGVRVSAEGAEGWRDLVQSAADRATNRFGSLVEDKGLSMTVHFRTKPELESDVRAWVAHECRRSGLELRSAKASVELHPPVEFDKGSVVEALVGGLHGACFLGDDVGDLSAFDALDRMRARGVHAVKVGVRTAEAPSVLLDRADVVVEGPIGALDLLRTL